MGEMDMNRASEKVMEREFVDREKLIAKIQEIKAGISGSALMCSGLELAIAVIRSADLEDVRENKKGYWKLETEWVDTSDGRKKKELVRVADSCVCSICGGLCRMVGDWMGVFSCRESVLSLVWRRVLAVRKNFVCGARTG